MGIKCIKILLLREIQNNKKKIFCKALLDIRNQDIDDTQQSRESTKQDWIIPVFHLALPIICCIIFHNFAKKRAVDTHSLANLPMLIFAVMFLSFVHILFRTCYSFYTLGVGMPIYIQKKKKVYKGFYYIAFCFECSPCTCSVGKVFKRLKTKKISTF